jgi:ABC-type amino acid transport substrate-binding protein
MADSLPFAFLNGEGALVGFDIEMAHQFARDLGVALDLVPVDRASTFDHVPASTCDLVMSGTVLTARRALGVLHSASYLDETLAFIVLDRHRHEFARWDQVRARENLRIGTPQVPYYREKIQAELPLATVVPLSSLDEIFLPRTPPLDASIATAERGSAYTLLHPAYSVVVPQPRPLKVPLAYLIADRDEALATVVNAWIDLKRKDGTIDELFAHWILGREAQVRRRRWSVLDDLLGWTRDAGGGHSRAR